MNVYGLILDRLSLNLPYEYEAPTSPVESSLASIWSDVLDVEPVGRNDDFFDLGGDSMAATAMAGEISDRFKVDFKPSQLVDLNTVATIARSLNDASGVLLPSNIVSINKSGSKTPLFMIHGGAGITFLRPGFLATLAPQQPVYLFQAKGFDGVEEPLDRVEEIATAYLRSVLEIQPEGPWNLLSFCAGGWIASEMIHQMEAEGLRPNKVILVDPGLPQALKDEYDSANGFVSRRNIPLLSPLATTFTRIRRDFTLRTKFFARTGSFVNGFERDSFSIPAVENYFVSRMKRKHLKRKSRVGSDLEEPGGGAEVSARRRDAEAIYASDAAARTSVKLELAFRSYIPRPLDFSVDIICSSSRAEFLVDPDFPINRLLPRRRIYISGETHEEAVTSPASASLIQSILDDTDLRKSSLRSSEQDVSV